MKTLRRLALVSCLCVRPAPAQGWREITLPTVAEAAAAFPAPPPEYGSIHWATWGGQQTKEGIIAQVAQLHANGACVIMLNASRGIRPKYFSPEYMELVRTLVGECKKDGMKVWLEDDGGYPSGFAAGMISERFPGLAMQGIVSDARYSVAAGQTLRIAVPPDTLGILAYNRQAGCAVLPVPVDGQLQWTAPNPGNSLVVFVRHVFRSSPTRYVNRADGTNDKDGLYSLIDYLNPDATRAFISLIHEGYEKVVGDEFGKTILGFRSDEPDYTGFMPWTPKLLETFRRIKGYDLLPYIPQFFEPDLTPEAQRAKADYWDVWSGMFRDGFFKVQADWCWAHGMEYMVHLNHEELMFNPALGEDMVRNEGSFFRDMRYVGVPGVDNLNQIGPGTVADFPKLAASAGHLFGRPQVWNEEGGELLQSGKFIADYNYVRGMNFLQIRGMAAAPAPDLMLNPGKTTAWYVNRASYLLANGRPAAQVALYHPTDSMWMGDKESDDVTVRLVTELMEHQIDFDHIDLDALASVVTPEGGGLRNLSGQVYRAVIIPTSTVIDTRVLERLRAFAAAGGRVVFVGRTPSIVVGRTFLQPEGGAPDLGFATLEPKPELTDRVVAALPPPDVKLDSPCPPLKYIRRNLKDGDVYFFFNESAASQSRVATLSGSGVVQVWDATSGSIHPLSGVAAAAGSVEVPLQLGPYESRFIVIGPAPGGMADAVPSVATAAVVLGLTGDWTVVEGDRRLVTQLKPWDALGIAGPDALATYHQDFSVSGPPPSGKRLYLDLGDVHEMAAVALNGRDLGALAWPPYVWDVTGVVKAGANAVDVRVQVPTPAERHGFYGARRPGGPSGTPHGISPTGVQGGLGGDDPMAGWSGFRQQRPGGPSIAAPAAPPVPALPSGLLGPVRLVAQ